MTQSTFKASWKKYLLVGSLGLNLLLGGLFIGAAIKGGGKPQPNFAGMRSVLFAMPDDKRGMLKEKFKARSDQNGDRRKALKDHSSAISQAIAAVPFERSALEQAFEAQQQTISVFSKASRDALVDTIAEMTDAERAAFLEKMKTHRKQKRGKPKN